ncbi:MAG TPA: dienelactone hydrolase family protein [Candidatus Cybelea sp.]|nr:dienelactone hydrolase family protein [Candidatus Cybelea sp.]
MIETAVDILTRDGTADGWLFEPHEEGRWPGVIHLTDIFGIRPASRDMAKRLAEQGYLVLEPNVFYRTRRPPVFDFPFKLGDERFMKRVGELTRSLTPEAIERDGRAYVDFLASHRSVAGEAFGVVGYCFTGAMALRLAAACPNRIAALASFHGGHLYADSPASPHKLLPRVRAQLYFAHGIEDRSMPKEAIEEFERALKAWGGQYVSEVYEGSRHGWTVPDNQAYDHAQAERAFHSLAGLFRRALPGSERLHAAR